MATGAYSKATLNGNWYEERLANEQKFRKEPDFRSLREEDSTISFIANNNLLMPLGRVKRAHPWDTSAVIVDDGFRETKTLNKTTYDPKLLTNYKGFNDCRPVVKTVQERKDYPEASHNQIQTAGSKTFYMLNGTNMQREINENHREVKQYLGDFGSTFKKHGDDHERFFKMTTYQQAFDKPKTVTPQEFTQTQGQKLKSFSGGMPRPIDQQGIRMNSTMTGEIFKSERDPQQNTRVQRSWLPYTENTIKIVEDNLRKTQQMNASMGLKSTGQLTNYKTANLQTKPYDIATSLPLGDGLHSVNSKWMETGAYRKIRTDVTLIRNQPITKK